MGKTFFPDVKFNKNNTAQLVKWFSNFREFYYIQMEKYSRQLLSEGLLNADDIHISADSELFRVLNLHYNRNNHIEVPTHFVYVVTQTMREFFKAIQAVKDAEPSWKKAIYKIIARLDEQVPDYFRTPNFLSRESPDKAAADDIDTNAKIKGKTVLRPKGFLNFYLKKKERIKKLKKATGEFRE